MDIDLDDEIILFLLSRSLSLIAIQQLYGEIIMNPCKKNYVNITGRLIKYKKYRMCEPASKEKP
jgi:hypothetical protein